MRVFITSNRKTRICGYSFHRKTYICNAECCLTKLMNIDSLTNAGTEVNADSSIKN